MTKEEFAKIEIGNVIYNNITLEVVELIAITILQNNFMLYK